MAIMGFEWLLLFFMADLGFYWQSFILFAIKVVFLQFMILNYYYGFLLAIMGFNWQLWVFVCDFIFFPKIISSLPF